MEINVISAGKQQKAGSLAVSDQIFGQEFNEALVHQVVTAYLSGGRAGTHAQKTRAEVSGGGKKPWRQKGTGSARSGTIRSPIWRKGGKTFAAVTQDYSQKVNRKMYRGALRSILSELVRQERLIVLENITVEQPKTKSLISQLKSLNLNAKNENEPSRILIISDTIDSNLLLASRNIRDISVVNVKEISPVNLISHHTVLITSNAVKQIEEALA